MELSISPWSKRQENENVAPVVNTQQCDLILAFDVIREYLLHLFRRAKIDNIYKIILTYQ